MIVHVRGEGWERFQQRLQNMQVGAREMAQTRFLIGSTLPYASHWIEEGWRDDPRYGIVHVGYRQPAATWFMRDAARQFGTVVMQRRPAETTVGAVFSAAQMQQWADAVADIMRDNLNTRVYAVAVPVKYTRRGAQPAWVRTHALYNSIRAYRL